MSGIVPTFYQMIKAFINQKRTHTHTHTHKHMCAFGTEKTVKANAVIYEREFTYYCQIREVEQNLT